MADDLDMLEALDGSEIGTLRRPGKKPARWHPKAIIAAVVKAATDALAKILVEEIAEEAKGRKDADKTLADRHVSLTATLTLAAGLSIAIGKTARTISVPGLKVGDRIVVTPKTALPGNLSLGDAYCLKEGELSLATINTGILALAITAKMDIVLGIAALR